MSLPSEAIPIKMETASSSTTGPSRIEPQPRCLDRDQSPQPQRDVLSSEVSATQVKNPPYRITAEKKRQYARERLPFRSRLAGCSLKALNLPVSLLCAGSSCWRESGGAATLRQQTKLKLVGVRVASMLCVVVKLACRICQPLLPSSSLISSPLVSSHLLFFSPLLYSLLFCSLHFASRLLIHHTISGLTLSHFMLCYPRVLMGQGG